MSGTGSAGRARVIAGVSGSPGSLRALRYAAEVAGRRGAVLLPVLAWTPPGGELADRRFPSPYLRQIWREAAARELGDALDLAFGGEPADMLIRPAVVRGPAGPVLIAAASEPGDVLVVGAGQRGSAGRWRGGRVARFCLARAACPVIAVPPADLAAAARGLRGWARRHRPLTAEAAGLPAGTS
ncbi:MAG TPA: universal stress protein [Streptosporangiaceae bacterium]